MFDGRAQLRKCRGVVCKGLLGGTWSKYLQIDAAIQQAYRGGQLRVERLAGKSLSLEDCFVNLCIVDHKRDNHRQLSVETSDADVDSDGDGQLSQFSLAARLKVTTPPKSDQVSLQTLFDLRKPADGSQHILN